MVCADGALQAADLKLSGRKLDIDQCQPNELRDAKSMAPGKKQHGIISYPMTSLSRGREEMRHLLVRQILLEAVPRLWRHLDFVTLHNTGNVGLQCARACHGLPSYAVM